MWTFLKGTEKIDISVGFGNQQCDSPNDFINSLFLIFFISC